MNECRWYDEQDSFKIQTWIIHFETDYVVGVSSCQSKTKIWRKIMKNCDLYSLLFPALETEYVVGVASCWYDDRRWEYDRKLSKRYETILICSYVQYNFQHWKQSMWSGWRGTELFFLAIWLLHQRERWLLIIIRKYHFIHFIIVIILLYYILFDLNLRNKVVYLVLWYRGDEGEPIYRYSF